MMLMHAGKRWAKYREQRQQEIDATIVSLQHGSTVPITEAHILQINQGGLDQHTWAHPDIAIAVAMWISPQFGAAVRSLTRRYMEGKIAAAESRAVAAAVHAASVPVQPEPSLPAKRPAAEIEDEVLASIVRSKQRTEAEFASMNTTMDSIKTTFSRMEDMAGAVPASQQLVQTLRANTIVRIGVAVENAQVRAIEGASGKLAIQAPSTPDTIPAASPVQLDLSGSITVQQVAATKQLAAKYTTSQVLSKIGKVVGNAWRGAGKWSMFFAESGDPMQFQLKKDESVPYNGPLGQAMATHRIQFSEAYRGAMEVAAAENISHDVWVYPRAAAASIISNAIDAYVAADRAAGHSSITNHFARAPTVEASIT